MPVYIACADLETRREEGQVCDGRYAEFAPWHAGAEPEHQAKIASLHCLGAGCLCSSDWGEQGVRSGGELSYGIGRTATCVGCKGCAVVRLWQALAGLDDYQRMTDLRGRILNVSGDSRRERRLWRWGWGGRDCKQCRGNAFYSHYVGVKLHLVHSYDVACMCVSARSARIFTGRRR